LERGKASRYANALTCRHVLEEDARCAGDPVRIRATRLGRQEGR
jgi:hypothetical protein